MRREIQLIRSLLSVLIISFLLMLVAVSISPRILTAQDMNYFDPFSSNEITWPTNGADVAIATPNGLWLYSLESQTPVRISDCGSATFNPEYSSNVSILAYNNMHGVIYVYNSRLNQTIAELNTQSQGVYEITLNGDGTRLAVAVSNVNEFGEMLDPRIQVWDLADAELIGEFHPIVNWPKSIGFAPDQDLIWVLGAYAGYDLLMNYADLYDYNSGSLVLRLTAQPADGAGSVIEGSWIASANSDPEQGSHWLELWNTTLAQSPRVAQLEENAYALALASSGNAVATAINGGIVQVWRGTTSVFRITEDRRINGLALSPEGDTLAVSIAGESMPIVDLWDVASGTRLASLDTADWLSQCAGA